MTLSVLDERGQTVTENNPIITEHNGTTGDIVILPLTLVNTAHDHYYRNITLRVNSIYPVLADLLIQTDIVPTYLPEKKIHRINPKESIKFNLRTIVQQNTKEQIVRGISINADGMRYPLT